MSKTSEKDGSVIKTQAEKVREKFQLPVINPATNSKWTTEELKYEARMRAFKWGIHSRRVDKHSEIRERVRMTPAVCPKCCLDLGTRNDLYGDDGDGPVMWEDLHEDDQKLLQDLVKQHIAVAHDPQQAKYLEFDAVPQKFFGNKKEQRKLARQKLAAGTA